MGASVEVKIAFSLRTY